MAEIWAFLEEPLKFDLKKMYLLITCAVYAVKEACLDPGLESETKRICNSKHTYE